NQGTQGDTGTQGTQGFQGFQGDTGAQGTQGDTGTQGFQGASPGSQSTVVTATSGTGSATVLCPAGTFAIGGGFEAAVSVDNEMLVSRPVGGSPATGWQAVSDDPRTVTVYAVCAP
ncbi:hypothetical protein RB628_26040, partial [Streptomyces sp. ADMS]|nr:hypothetical protein [Streptomyces sp. ADMS]